jgi:dihydrofolate reductase
MRRIRYAVAMSLDGYIAGPNGEYDWIIQDPEIDFGEIFSRYDTAVMGRRTFELVLSQGRGESLPGMRTIVVSRTLRQADHPDVTILGEDFEPTLGVLRAGSGKDIWLFGGGSLFRSLLPPPARRARLELIGSKIYKSGIVSLEYAIETPQGDLPAT